MKSSLDEIFGKCGAEEVEILMKDFEFDTADVPTEKIYQKALKKSGIAKKNVFRLIGISAACIVIAAVGITVGISLRNTPYVIDDGSSENTESELAVKEVEYKEAVRYCQENNIFIEGLSKKDVKQVYDNLNNSDFVNVPEEKKKEYNDFAYEFTNSYSGKNAVDINTLNFLYAKYGSGMSMEKYYVTYDNILSTNQEYNVMAQECDKFTDDFCKQYDKGVPKDKVYLVQEMFYSYYKVELTQKQRELIYESMLMALDGQSVE